MTVRYSFALYFGVLHSLSLVCQDLPERSQPVFVDLTFHQFFDVLFAFFCQEEEGSPEIIRRSEIF
jgi:hypothetical protein